MIYVCFKGRLGNQMFQYAFARYLQSGCPNNPLFFDFKDVVCMRSDTEEINGWENALQYFNIKPYTDTDRPPFRSPLGGRFLMRFFWNNKPSPDDASMMEIYNYEMKMAPLMEKYHFYYISQGFYPFKKLASSRQNAIVCGLFESRKYFDVIRSELVREFTPKNPPLAQNKDLYYEIDNENSVCVSIRRGDFVSNPSLQGKFNICTEQYFYRAMEYMKTKVDNPLFVLFSDDIEWAKEAFADYDGRVAFETEGNPVWEKLRLMYSCKHFIISNSTFSWWCQYLSRNEDKIVIAPDRWFNTDRQSDLLEERMIKIDPR